MALYNKCRAKHMSVTSRWTLVFISSEISDMISTHVERETLVTDHNVKPALATAHAATHTVSEVLSR